MKKTIGAEIWRGHVVSYYNVKAKDIPHFMAADGADLSDISYRIADGQSKRMMIEYDIRKGADGIDEIARILGVTFMQAVQNINSRFDYKYYRGL